MIEARPTPDDHGPVATGVLDPVLRRVLEAAGMAVATLDPEGHVVTATAAFAAHWGRRVDDLLGLHLVGVCDGAHQAGVTAALVRLVEGASEIETIESMTDAGTNDETGARVVRMTFGRVAGADGRTESLVATVNDVTTAHRAERRRRRAALEAVRLTSQDGPTGLPVGRGVEQLLASAVRRSSRTGMPVSLLCCEVTGLTEQMDRLGTNRADDLLSSLTERLSARLRASDAVGRSGHDRFLVVAEDLGDEQDAAGVAYRLLSSVVEPIVVDGSEIRLGMTVGVVVADGAASATRMLDTVAVALHQAKQDGVGGFRLVDIRSGLAA